MQTKQEIVTAEELLISNMYEIQAVINILEGKGLFTKTEVLAEIIKLKEERNKKLN